MDRGIKSALAGLLIAVVISGVWAQDSHSASQTAAQSAEDVLKLQTTGVPANPAAGTYWTYTILVDHPVTQEVIVRPPAFPQSMNLERVITSPRLIRKEGEEQPERWTAIEFLFSLRSAGTFTLNSFQITAAHKRNTTDPLTLRITAAPNQGRRAAPVFRWERIPASLTSGTETELILALSNWDPSKPVPGHLFRGRIPEKFIMEEMPFLNPGTDQIIRYPVKIIALETGALNFGPLRIQIEGENIEIPRLNIQVIRNPEKPHQGNPVDESADIEIQDIPPFKEIIEFQFDKFFGENVFPLFRREYAKIIILAEELWTQGNYAGALAFIRANERDRFFGPSLKTFRGEMEESLGIVYSFNETWKFRNYIIIGIVLTVTFFIIKGYKIKSKNHFIAVLGGFAAANLIVIFIVFGYSGSSQTAVLERTDIFRVPDSTGAIIGVFDEGQPAAVRAMPGEWRLVETEDGRQGWVPADNVLIY